MRGFRKLVKTEASDMLKEFARMVREPGVDNKPKMYADVCLKQDESYYDY